MATKKIVKKVAKKAPVKKVAKKAPVKKVAKKAPVKKVAKKAPVKKVAESDFLDGLKVSSTTKSEIKKMKKITDLILELEKEIKEMNNGGKGICIIF